MTVTADNITPKIILDMIKNQLNLEENQAWVYNQRQTIPKEDGLFVVVGLDSVRVYGNNTYYDDDSMGLEEKVGTWVLEHISINLFSRDYSAIMRQAEVLASFVSTYSQQVAFAYALRFGKIPSTFVDRSSREGTSILYRFVISIPVYRCYVTVKPVAYFDNFSHTITNNP